MLTYVTVLAPPILLIVILICLSSVLPAPVLGIGIAVLVIAPIAYMIKNFVVLMSLDMTLALLSCRNTARKIFYLPRSFNSSKVERRAKHFGKGCDPIAVEPRPDLLRYKLKFSQTVYSSGIEMVVASYRVRLLDKDTYLSIFNSALANSKALKGRKRQWLLDKYQKRSPLNRATVVFIFAKHIDEKFRASIFDSVCKNDGDGMNNAILPCIIDEEKNTCIFNSERLPYVGFGYPVKNRGIRLIRKYVFGGKLPLFGNDALLDPIKDLEPDRSLWELWHKLKRELIVEEKNNKRRFASMSHGQLQEEDGFIYIKWEERGVWLAADVNDDSKMVEVDPIVSWCYPKSNAISKKAAADIKNLICKYYAERGYTVNFDNN